MPLQQVQGVSICSQKEGEQCTITRSGDKQRLDVSTLSIGPVEWDRTEVTKEPTKDIFLFYYLNILRLRISIEYTDETKEDEIRFTREEL